jgi:hypothetical protein
MSRPLLFLHGLLAAVLLPIGLAGCPAPVPDPVIAVTHVEYTNTVVLPGETITMLAEATGADSLDFLWESDAGEFTTPGQASTDWTAPPVEQLVAVKVTASAGDNSDALTVDLLVGYGLDHDGDGYSLRQGDCDDTNPAIYPGSPDIADGLDNDCDGETDEGSPDADDDGDGYSDLDGDCDDTNDTVFPGGEEVINGLDDDCDSTIDEGTDAYDDDGDGYSELDEPADCNDNSSAVSPDAPETLDGVDNNCNGTIDEGTAGYDDDGDGYTELGGDCDDDPAGDGPVAFPGAIEALDDVDNDCDGLVDEDFMGDGDGDGWSVLAGDCDDDDFYSYPYAPEFLDGADNDCNGSVDDALDTTDDDGDGCDEAGNGCAGGIGDCDDTLEQVYPEAPEIDDVPLDLDNDCDGFFFVNPPFALASMGAASNCANGADDDGDGWIDGADPDCVTSTGESGLAFTACNDGADNDGDGLADNLDPECSSGLDNDEVDGAIDDCADGADNDGDGWLDGDDPDCVSAPFDEMLPGVTECNDLSDNDGDGAVDSLDPECDDGFDGSESSAAPDDCEDGLDGDGDGWTDDADPDCLGSPFDEAGLGAAACNDGIDNDGDGEVDAQDAGCSDAGDVDEVTSTCGAVALDGSLSWDPDDDVLVHYWYFDVQPINSNLASEDIIDGMTPFASFTPDVSGYWSVALIVSDGMFNSDPAYLSFEVVEGSCR